MAPTALLGATGLGEALKAASDASGKIIATVALNEDLDLCAPDSPEASFKWNITQGQLGLLLLGGFGAYLLYLYRSGMMTWDPLGLKNISGAVKDAVENLNPLERLNPWR